MSQTITEVLSKVRGGHALADAGNELADVVLAVKATGKKGSVTLTIDVEPDKTDETVVTLQPKIKVSKPVKPYSKGIFFVNDRNGHLTQEDPRQLELLAEQEAEKEAKREQERAAGITHLDKVGRG